MSKLTTWMICVALSAALVQPVFAADNELTPEEKAAGWQLLFNGNDYNHWRCNNGRKIASKIEDHCLVPHKSGGYLIIYDKEFWRLCPDLRREDGSDLQFGRLRPRGQSEGPRANRV